jgi:hypothetical protein
MNDKEKLQRLKENYDNIEIPCELDDIVNNALYSNKYNTKASLVKSLSLVASLVAVFVCSVNTSPLVANALDRIPVIGRLVKVVKLSNYSFSDKNGVEVSVDVAKVEGLKDKDLEKNLNDELEKEAKTLYQQYVEESKILGINNKQTHQMLRSSYEVKVNNKDILSLVVSNYEFQASSDTTRKFYNINKKSEKQITLKSMFENVDYINIISENIKSQMEKQMKLDPNSFYWINTGQDDDFKTIKKNQGFYINEKNELVVCFDKYEVGPGSMGAVDFTIPNEVLKPNLN